MTSARRALVALFIAFGTLLVCVPPAGAVPTVSVTVGTAFPTVGQSATYSAAGLCDVPPCRYQWRWYRVLSTDRLGTTMGEGPEITYAFSTPGLKRIMLKVTNATRTHGFGVAGAVVLVLPAVPAADPAPTTTVPVPTPVPDPAPTGVPAPTDIPSTDAVPTDAVPTDAVPTDTAVPTDAVPTDVVLPTDDPSPTDLWTDDPPADPTTADPTTADPSTTDPSATEPISAPEPTASEPTASEPSATELPPTEQSPVEPTTAEAVPSTDQP